jgi:hypothetical protein
VTTRVMTACLLTAGVLLAGCSSTTGGNPEPNAANPTEPTVATPRPTVSKPAPTPSVKAAMPPVLAPQALPAQNGYVFIQTKSGQTRCQISANEVGCEAPFTAAPTVGGMPATGVRMTAAGQEQWVVGNLGAIPAVTIDYRPYTAVGWTIDAKESGTTFTNVSTGRGMTVAIENVSTF